MSNDTSVSELIERYKVGRTHFYQVRLAAMKTATGIEPFKRGGNKSYISADGVKFLDSLDLWIQQNGSDIDRFLFERYGIGEPSVNSSEITVNDSDSSIALAVMSQLATALENLKADKSVLDNYRELEECARNGWLIPKSKLARLMEINSNSIKGEKLIRFGFIATKTDEKSRESIWRVEKVK